MNSESGKKLSMEELKERNRHQQPPIIQQAEQCPTPEEWAYLMDRIDILDRRVAEISAALPRLNMLATREQMDKLMSELRTLTETIRQAGKKKEQSSLRLRFPAISPRWLLSIPILMVLAVVLYGMLYSLGELWSVFRTLLP